jgi:hypothetical protein
MSTHEELRRTVLRVLSKPRSDAMRFGLGQYSLYDTVNKEGSWNGHQFMVVTWELVADGLIFLNYHNPSQPEYWTWGLTERGKRLVETGTYDPSDPEGYLKRLSAIEGLDPAIPVYAQEALLSYESKCYLACAVMLGVASEAAFDVLTDSFQKWNVLSESEGKALGDAIKGRQYAARFEQVRKRLEPKKRDLPEELSDGLDIVLTGVLELLRVNRNDSGHPTRRYIGETPAYASLQLFERYVGRLYELKRFFDANPRV